ELATKITALEKSNKSLQEENSHLKSQEKSVQQKQQVKSVFAQEKIHILEKTIALLEKGLKKTQLQKIVTKVIVQNPTKAIIKKTKQKQQAQAKIFKKEAFNQTSKDIKTPHNSKAVQTFSLLSKKTTTQKKVVKKQQTQKTQQQTEKNKVIVPVKERFTYKDSDLLSPQSPIQLEARAGARDKYMQAYHAYSQRDYPKAIQKFQEFLQRFPNDKNADNSQYWIALAEIRQGHTVLAEQAVRKVLKNYTHGETAKGFKTPDAILMLGQIYGKRGETRKSRYYFEHIVKQYPTTLSANKAERELKAILKKLN
ncbi:MAG: tol-pal system protein YbgF, partial [bacterium]